MRNFLLGVLLLPALAQAQPVTVEKPVICDKTEKVIESLQKGQYKEKPIWIGYDDDDKSNFVLFSNDQNKTWTILQFNENIACILGVGKGSRLVFFGPKT